ncbi:MAG: hypothetical protein WC975_03430 [Phycisphaerae bacterium]
MNPWSHSFLQSNRFQLLYWIEQLRSLPTGTVVLALAAGIILLLYGRPLFRLIIILNAMPLMGWLGWQLGLEAGRPYWFSIGFAVIFGLLAWPMFKLGIALLCGLAGTALALQLATLFAKGGDYWPIFAVAGFILCALIGWILLKAAITVFTAMEGSTMIILSLVVLAERASFPIKNVSWLTFTRPGVVHAVILILGIVGIMYQFGLSEKSHKQSPHPEK